MKLFLQKNAKFSSAGGEAHRPPLASGGWGLCPQTPQAAPPHCELLATRLAMLPGSFPILRFPKPISEN